MSEGTHWARQGQTHTIMRNMFSCLKLESGIYCVVTQNNLCLRTNRGFRVLIQEHWSHSAAAPILDHLD